MIVRFSFLLAVFGSIISQIPTVLSSSWGNPLKYLWILPAFLLCFESPKEYLDRPIKWFLLFVLYFGLFGFVMEAFSLQHYLGRDMYNIMISFLIFSVSYKYWLDYGNEKQIKLISFFILISGVLLAYFLYVDYLRGGNLLSRNFAYNKGKNSASMIILCSILISLLNFYNKKKWINIVKYVFFAFMFYVVVLLRSRATFVGVIYIIYYFIFRIHNRKLTFSILFLSAIAVIWVMTHPSLYNTVVNGILLAGRDAEDLNELSSGRVYLLSEAWDIFKQNMWLGNGNMYMDCMPIVVLAQYGLIGASSIYVFLIFLGIKVYKFFKNDYIYLTSFLLFNVFLLNSLFEAQPPFGPGVKCFMLWMMLGFSFANIKLKRKTIEKYD